MLRFANPFGRATRALADEETAAELNWGERVVTRLSLQRNIAKPTNWQDYQYPFVYGQFDASLMPLKDWRACSHQSLFVPAVKKW